MLEFVRGAYNQAVLPGITRPLHTTDRDPLKKNVLEKISSDLATLHHEYLGAVLDN